MKNRARDAVMEVHRAFKEKGGTLAVAESCTGGLLAHWLTEVAGASSFFLGGVVAYAEGMKTRVLGVPGASIEERGVVSEECARLMAEGVRALAGADYALGTTGNLGPDALEGKPRGLIYVAASAPGETRARELRLGGSRHQNKEEAALAALELLLTLIEAHG
jgi:PncC family amidohydrolase